MATGLAILKLPGQLPASERKMLPEVQQTADALYARATDLARTLHAMDTNLDAEGLDSDRRANRGLIQGAGRSRASPALGLLEPKLLQGPPARREPPRSCVGACVTLRSRVAQATSSQSRCRVVVSCHAGEIRAVLGCRIPCPSVPFNLSGVCLASTCLWGLRSYDQQPPKHVP